MTFDEISAYVATVSEAFQAFVNAPVSQKRAILQQTQHLLLTDIADELATACVFTPLTDFQNRTSRTR